MTNEQLKNDNEKPADPSRLRLTEVSQIGVRKALTVISCGITQSQQFVRVHPSEDYRMQTALFTDEVNRGAYLVAPELWDELAGKIQPTFLFASITKTPNVFLGAVRCGAIRCKIREWATLDSNDHQYPRETRHSPSRAT